MPRTFRRHGDGIRAHFDRVEVDLLRGLRTQLRTILEQGDSDDPVFRRLFPPAVLGDAQVDGEVRALFHDELLERRLRGLDDLVTVLERGSEHRGGLRVELTDDEPLLVLGVLNDLRLAIGASVDIEALDRDTVTDEALAYRLAVMDHLAWLQEQLLAIIDPVSVTHTDRPDGEQPR
jgi:hypothetical protein